MGIEALFRSDALTRFDFSRAPEIVRRAGSGGNGAPHGLDLAEWSRLQARYLDPAHAPPLEDAEAAMRESVLAYDRFFRERGLLRGSVLDIGGSSGLYRQWSERGASDVFVVQDPAVGSPRMGTHELMRRHYPRAFTLPVTFVEGFGEELPYRDGVFDTCLIVAALDHCADPARVLAEASRCLKPGGELLLLQGCRLPVLSERVGYSVRLVYREPVRLLRKLRKRLSANPGKHMHRFDVAGVASLLEAAAFHGVEARGPIKKRVFAFQATKPGCPSRGPARAAPPMGGG